MEKSLHMLIYRIFHAQRNYLRPSLAKYGLGSGQPKILNYLSVHGACCQRELAQFFEIDPAAISRMLESMEKGGFISRSTDDVNRRADVISITEKGEEAYGRWREDCTAMQEIMLRGFTEEEKRALSDSLLRIYANLSSAESKG